MLKILFGSLFLFNTAPTRIGRNDARQLPRNSNDRYLRQLHFRHGGQPFPRGANPMTQGLYSGAAVPFSLFAY